MTNRMYTVEYSFDSQYGVQTVKKTFDNSEDQDEYVQIIMDKPNVLDIAVKSVPLSHPHAKDLYNQNDHVAPTRGTRKGASLF